MADEYRPQCLPSLNPTVPVLKTAVGNPPRQPCLTWPETTARSVPTVTSYRSRRQVTTRYNEERQRVLLLDTNTQSFTVCRGQDHDEASSPRAATMVPLASSSKAASWPTPNAMSPTARCR